MKCKESKEEITEDYCFICKDGGLLLICEYKDCPKVYHPSCVGKDDSFLDAGEYWACSWHSCFICHKSSNIQCFSCPSSVCRTCIREAEFVQLRKTKGLCNNCLKLAILIEENVDVDSDGGKVDFNDAETYEFLFKSYWEIVKDQERLTLEDLCTADVQLRKVEHCKSGPESDVGDMDINFSDGITFLEDDIVHKTKRKATIKRYQSNKRNFIGWGSVELVEFLTSIGKDTREPLMQLDVCEIIKEYIYENNLLHPNKKKKMVMYNEKLRFLFRKKSVKLHKIYSLLKSHFSVNEDMDDEPLFNSDEDDGLMVCKRQRRKTSDPQTHKVEHRNERAKVLEPLKICYASMVDKNIKLLYLRRSLIREFLKYPDSLESKVMGCFVRVKSDPKDLHYSPNRIYQLGQVTGTKKASEVYMIGEMRTDVVLCVSNLWKDIRISMLSDDDFEEEECEDLRKLVKKGLLKRRTVAELEERVRSIHEDIMSHWIQREIATLQRRIDRANEKGWIREKFECIERRELLKTDAEQTRLLKDIPKVIQDTEEVGGIPDYQLNSQRENEGNGTLLSQKTEKTNSGNGPTAHVEVTENEAEGNRSASSEDAVEGIFEGIGAAVTITRQLDFDSSALCGEDGERKADGIGDAYISSKQLCMGNGGASQENVEGKDEGKEQHGPTNMKESCGYEEIIKFEDADILPPGDKEASVI